MTHEDNVQTVVWPTTEPELPPKPAPQPAAAVAPPAAESEAAEPTADALPAGIGAETTHAFVWQHAAEAAAVLRTLMLHDEGGDAEGPLAGMNARQVATAFLSGLGAVVGSRVVARLHGEVESRWMARAVAEEKPVRHNTAVAALDFVRRRVEAGEYLEGGGPEYALQLFEGAFGANRARLLLRSDQGEGGFQLLKGVAPDQVAPFISHEHPQTIAIVLSQLAPAQAGGIIAHLPERMQADVAYRMASMEPIAPAVLVGVEEALEASLRDILSDSQAVGGPKVVADMLNYTGSSVEKNVLDQMDAQAPRTAESVRNLMFTFADIVKLTDRELQVWLREIDQKDLTVALKAAEQELMDKILGNMSEDVGALIMQEMEKLGPMRLSEVEEVQLRCVQQARLLEEQGKVTIVRGDADDIWT